MKVLLATSNTGKIREMKRILEPALRLKGLTGVTLVIPGGSYPYELPAVVETGRSFEENAVIKATAMAAATGLVSLADDSGLEVEALAGMPGVNSARFAGEKAGDRENNARLLSLMAGLPPERRQARFRCVVAIAVPGGTVRTAEGTCEGLIVDRPRGDGGFGYDPLFLVPALGRTFAELSEDEKDGVSHRGQALRRAAVILGELAAALEDR